MVWYNPFSWLAPKPVEGFEEAAAEISATPADVGAGYRQMAKVLIDMAEACDLTRAAADSASPAAMLAAKNHVLYGDDSRRMIFGPPEGEQGPAPLARGELVAMGFSDDQAGDLAALIDAARLTALEWDRQSRTGELKVEALKAEI